MIQFSSFFIFIFLKIHRFKGEVLKQRGYLNKLRLCGLAAFSLHNGALFAHFEYSNVHLSAGHLSGKLL